MVEFVLRMIRKLFGYFPTARIILFESNPDFSCNTFPVYKRILETWTGYNFVWLMKEHGKCKDKRVKGIYAGKEASFFEKVVLEWYLNRCIVMISSNVFQHKRKKEQLFLFLTHGSKTKKTRGIYEMGDAVDFINVQSHFFDDIITYEYNCKKEQLVYLGYPRCDYLLSSRDVDVKHLIDREENEKYVIWLPTFRASKNGRIDVQNDLYDNIGIPTVYSIKKLNELNDFLAKRRLHILYKPHPAQDMKVVKSVNLSNFHVISDQSILDTKLQLYEVIGGSEALITDYSSVFFDYLLLDHPIATTTDDIESWKNGRGFAFDLESMYNQATVRVKDQDELQMFLEEVSKGHDKMAQGRRKIRDITNMHIDGKSTERVVEFVRQYLEKTV